MKEMIKVKNASYILYEELLLKKENLRKEGEQIYVSYLKEFGDLLMEAFRKKVECIRKKKMIAFCQRCRNRGEVINSQKLREAVTQEMKSYEDCLKAMAQSVKNAKESERVRYEEYLRVKEIYYRLARKIHPDMRPELAEDQVIRDFWNRIVIAYQYNQLRELEELEVLVKAYLEQNHINQEELIIEGVDKKISRLEKEIDAILSGTPYTFRFLLEDEEKRDQKKNEIQEEIREYSIYSAELEEILKGYPIVEMYA